MSEDERLYRAYLMASVLLSDDLAKVEQLCEMNRYSTEGTEAIKKNVQEIVNYLYSMANHYHAKLPTQVLSEEAMKTNKLRIGILIDGERTNG